MNRAKTGKPQINGEVIDISDARPGDYLHCAGLRWRVTEVTPRRIIDAADLIERLIETERQTPGFSPGSSDGGRRAPISRPTCAARAIRR